MIIQNVVINQILSFVHIGWLEIVHYYLQDLGCSEREVR